MHNGKPIITCFNNQSSKLNEQHFDMKQLNEIMALIVRRCNKIWWGVINLLPCQQPKWSCNWSSISVNDYWNGRSIYGYHAVLGSISNSMCTIFMNMEPNKEVSRIYNSIRNMNFTNYHHRTYHGGTAEEFIIKVPNIDWFSWHTIWWNAWHWASIFRSRRKRWRAYHFRARFYR